MLQPMRVLLCSSEHRSGETDRVTRLHEPGSLEGFDLVRPDNQSVHECTNVTTDSLETSPEFDHFKWRKSSAR